MDKEVSQSVQLLSRVQLLRSHGLQHTRFRCPSPPLGACSNSSPLSRWDAIQPSLPLLSPSQELDNVPKELGAGVREKEFGKEREANVPEVWD